MKKRTRLPELAEIVEGSVLAQQTPSVYFLVNEGAVCYVGISKNPMERIAEHGRVGALTFDRYHILPCASEAEARAIEREYVKKLNPRYNVVHRVPGTKSRTYGGGAVDLAKLLEAGLSFPLAVRVALEEAGGVGKFAHQYDVNATNVSALINGSARWPYRRERSALARHFGVSEAWMDDQLGLQAERATTPAGPRAGARPGSSR